MRGRHTGRQAGGHVRGSQRQRQQSELEAAASMDKHQGRHECERQAMVAAHRQAPEAVGAYADALGEHQRQWSQHAQQAAGRHGRPSKPAAGAFSGSQRHQDQQGP